MAQIPNRFGDRLDPPSEGEAVDPAGGLVSWVMTRVKRGRDVRDQKYATRWKEYTRLWRGMWSGDDKNTDSERSKLIAPALQQAIEMTVAEIEEAVFGRIAWFDIDDDVADEDKEDVLAYRDMLLDDFAFSAVPDGISKVFLLGAIYGTGIAKLNVGLKDSKRFVQGQVQTDQQVIVTVEAVRPDEFVIDPAATCVDEALYVAHEVVKPLHSIKEKQKAGVYKKGSIGGWAGKRGDSTGTGATSDVQSVDDACLITEYFGLVPAYFLDGEGEGLVEAIVTIANEGTLLRAVESPFTMKDRPIVAYQHDTVPGEFWGRGVAEKGYNPQKALDAELRARIDALALMTAPMLGADVGRLPRNPDLRVRPGKVFLTRGRPSEVLEPIGFNAAGLAATFQQSGDLERMVQMGTGAMDSATPIGINSRNETASGMSMLQSGFIKRSKRTMQNIERQFLNPLIQKCLWRYMQFDPERYQEDTRFVVHSAMGIMAKEVENSQLVQMLGFTQPGEPARQLIIKALFSNSVSSEKQELMQAVQQMMAPPSEEEQRLNAMMQEIQVQMAQQNLRKLTMEADKIAAEAVLAQAKAMHETVKADLADDMVEIQAANAATGAAKIHIDRIHAGAQHARNIVEMQKAKILAQKAKKPTS